MSLDVMGYGLLAVSFAAAAIGIDSLVFARAPGTAAGVSLKRPTSALAHVLGHFGARLVPKAERERRALDLMLLQAGYDAPEAAAVYFGARIVGGLGFALIAAAICVLAALPARAMLTPCIAAGLIGFLLPRLILKTRLALRQQQVREGLPDMLDLLLVCSEAGLGLEMAIARVGEEIVTTRPLLAEQLRQIGRELLAGRSKLDALKAFAERTGIAETASLVRLLVQSDALGVSIGTTLRIFAEEIQSHRMLKAEEIAHKVSAKLSMVLVACFLPAVMIVVIAPIIAHAVASWRTLHP